MMVEALPMAVFGLRFRGMRRDGCAAWYGQVGTDGVELSLSTADDSRDAVCTVTWADGISMRASARTAAGAIAAMRVRLRERHADLVRCLRGAA